MTTIIFLYTGDSMKDLFLNGTILISFIALVNQFIRDLDFNPASNIKLKLVGGVISGILGCILMIFSVEVIPGVIVDFRNIAIILASMFGGLVTSILAGLIIGAFRLLWFGVSESSMMEFLVVLLMGIGCPLITYKVRSKKRKCLYLTIFNVFISNIAFIVLIKDHTLLLQLLLSYNIGCFIITFILCFFINNLATSNRLFKKYKNESSIDFLTGLYNVRQFDKTYNDITSRIIEKDERLSLLFIDIDYFKKINDTFGHAEGDMILKELGKRLLTSCRDFDIISRIGGEEFSVLLLDCHTQQARNIAERIRSSVEKHKFSISNGKTVCITVSIGIATYPDTTINFNHLIKEADKALYEAKQTGRNKVVLAGILNE